MSTEPGKYDHKPEDISLMLKNFDPPMADEWTIGLRESLTAILEKYASEVSDEDLRALASLMCSNAIHSEHRPHVVEDWATGVEYDNGTTKETYVTVDFPKVRSLAKEELRRRRPGNVTVESLSLNLCDNSIGVRIMAVEELALMDEPRALELVVKAAVSDEDYDVKKAAAKAAVASFPTCIPMLQSVLSFGDNEARERTVEILAEIKDPAVIDSLERALEDKNRDVREPAIEALSELDDKRVIPLLIRALKFRKRVRETVGRALAERWPQEAVEPLLDSLAEAEPDTAEAAQDAIRRILTENAAKLTEKQLHKLAQIAWVKNLAQAELERRVDS